MTNRTMSLIRTKGIAAGVAALLTAVAPSLATAEVTSYGVNNISIDKAGLVKVSLDGDTIVGYHTMCDVDGSYTAKSAATIPKDVCLAWVSILTAAQLTGRKVGWEIETGDQLILRPPGY